MVLLSDSNKLIETEQSSSAKTASLIEKYRIPVNHFEYSYIENCKDGGELEKIVQVLRSGEEGYFPDLTRFAEKRLAAVKPKSKLLSKVCPVLCKDALSKDARSELENDITQWLSTISKDDEELHYFKDRNKFTNLPDVRKSKATTLGVTPKPKRISSTDYSSWDKYDPDTELLKMDLEEEKLKKTAEQLRKKTAKKCVQFKEFTTNVEALREANYEKEKGNEFFKTGDYTESLRHYTTSINCKATLAAYTNRALAHIKLRNYKQALDDCHSALAIDSYNLKALLRKAQALEGLKRYKEALETVEHAIKLDANNAAAQELADKVRKLCGVTSKSTRFVVNEVENVKVISSKNAKGKLSSSEKNGKVIIPIPGTSSMSPPHYVTCTNNFNVVKEHTIRASTPTHIVHLVSVDTSDEDDDSCTINHLTQVCSQDVINKNLDNRNIQISNKLEKAAKDEQETEYINMRKLKSSRTETRAIAKTIKEDKIAGGEPYVKDGEFNTPEDIHSPYSFLRMWNSASSDRALEQHAALLRSVDMNRIVEVIGCKLDNAMFSTMLRCLCMHFAVPGEVDRLHVILTKIVNLPRFDIILMLISSEDRNCINALVNFLTQHGNPLSQLVLNKLFSTYY